MLIDDEIKIVVETCIMLSNMGPGTDEDKYLQVCNEIVTQRIEKNYFIPVTKGVFVRIILKMTYSG